VEANHPYTGESLLDPEPDPERVSLHELVTSWRYTDRETGETKVDRDSWVAVRQGAYKLLHVEGTPFWQLYDDEADPLERKPLGAAHEATAVRMRKAMEEWQRNMKDLARSREAGPKAELSEQELERLRSLGYIR
jgi:hypothetical protein